MKRNDDRMDQISLLRKYEEETPQKQAISSLPIPQSPYNTNSTTYAYFLH